MDILETMKARHSVRQYKNQAIESSKREKINALIKDVNAESKLSIQVFYDEPKCFDSFMAHYGKFENVKKNEWFEKGMEAVSLAPTAVNQQKFYFELKNGIVTAKNLGGFYSRIDLGIVKYHFEVVTGHEVK